MYFKVLAHKRTYKNKIYSIHKPFTSCIAKGKAHKQYEFCNKVGLITTSKTWIITAIKSFTGNPHDSKTIEPVIGRLKTVFRMGLNYLSGSESSQINAFLDGTGWNLKKMMKKLKPN